LPPTNTTAGFSLVEVMIAILVLGIALVGLTQGITTALSSGKESELQATAAMFAAGQVELLRCKTGIEDEETDGDCGAILPLYRWRQSVTPAGIDGLHQVTVVVEDARTGRAIYELQTLLFERPEESSSGPGRQSQQRQGGSR
jgi:prepilin-type N-terminal cleavage/methylation domain-containing protein